MPTRREINNRLFPSIEWDNGWSLSLQADSAGYACFPKERLDTLEEYSSVEVCVYGPFSHPVDLSTLDIPDEVFAKFNIADDLSYAIGCYLNKEDVQKLTLAILKATTSNPNAGIPRGSLVWADRDVYHGTSQEYAADILHNGIDLNISSKGYFGKAFYVAEDKDLAISNYADFSGDDDGGAVLSFRIAEGSRILDLRNPIDSEEWFSSGLSAKIDRDEMPLLARQQGVDGIYDRSVGGLAIFNPSVLQFAEVIELKNGSSGPNFC